MKPSRLVIQVLRHYTRPAVPIQKQRFFYRVPTNCSNVHNLFRSYTTTVSKDFADVEQLRLNTYKQLQETFQNQSMNPKIKAQRLKDLIFSLIPILPSEEFSQQQLPFVNAIINFIDQTPKSSDSFSVEEMLLLLKSVLGGMTLEEVKYIDFFPRFYNSLRETTDYHQDKEVRLQLFEIFVNYVLLSPKRGTLGRVIDAFIKEENDLHAEEAKGLEDSVVEILLEAFKTIKPDTLTVVKLWELASSEALSSEERLNSMLECFFKAADEELSAGFDDNFVNQRLINVLDILEQKVKAPVESYVELLYFSTTNNYDDVCQSILNKLEKFTNKFTAVEYQEIFVGEVLYALVDPALSLGKVDDVENLLAILKRKSETEYTEEEWMAIMQWETYKTHEYKPAIDIVNELNNKLESLGKDFAFADTDSYNLVLESLCWSNKSYDYIKKFKEKFEDEYGLQLDAKSIATIFNYLIKNNQIEEAAHAFLKNKDNVDWENEYEGYYMLSLFKMNATVWENADLSWDLKMNVYKNVKKFEYLFDKESVYRMVTSSFAQNEPAFAIMVFLDQTPVVKKGDKKLDPQKYHKIFDSLYAYLLKSKDAELNQRVYKYLNDSFDITYDYFPGFVKMFIDSGRPHQALRVFADMKALSKEKRLPPPSEEFYIYLFKAFGQYQDEESIFKLHLAMKMDLSINLDIKLLNAVMESYAQLEDPFKTRDSFNTAFSLPKEHGLNNESAYWMLKSLKYATLEHTKNFYNGLSEYEVLPDSNLFAEYLIANCYFEQYRTALDTLIDTNENGDRELINDHVLKTLHNNCLHEGVRKDLDKYATECFPKVWDQLKLSGDLHVNDDYPDLLASPYDKPTIDVKRLE